MKSQLESYFKEINRLALTHLHLTVILLNLGKLVDHLLKIRSTSIFLWSPFPFINDSGIAVHTALFQLKLWWPIVWQ